MELSNYSLKLTLVYHFNSCTTLELDKKIKDLSNIKLYFKASFSSWFYINGINFNVESQQSYLT